MVTGRKKKASVKNPDQPVSVDDLCKILENLIEFQNPTHPQASSKLNRKRKQPSDTETPQKSFTSFNTKEKKAFDDFFALLLLIKDHDLERGFGSDELVANSKEYCAFFRQGILPLYAIPCSHLLKPKEDSNPIHTSPLLGLVTYIYEVELKACWARELSAKNAHFFNDKIELGCLWEDLLTAFGDGIRTHVIDTDPSPELTAFKGILGPVQFPFVASVMQSKYSPKISAKVPRALLESVEALAGASPDNKELIKSPSVIGPGLLSDVICDHSDFMYANVALQLAFTVAPLLRPVKIPGKKSPTPAEARKARTNWFKQIFPSSKFGQELANEVVVKLVEMVSRQFWIGVGAIHNRLVRDDDDKARSIPIISGDLNDTKLEWDEDSIPVTRSNVQFNKSTLTWCSVDLLDPGSKTRGIEMNAEVNYEEIARSELKMGITSMNGDESHMELVLYLKTPPIIEGIPIKRTSGSFLSLIISSRYDFMLPRLLKNRNIRFTLIPSTPFEAIGAEKGIESKVHAEPRDPVDRTLSKVSINKEHLLAVNVGYMSREGGAKSYPDSSQARAANVEREAQSDLSRDDMGPSVNSIKSLQKKTLGHRFTAQGDSTRLQPENDKSAKNIRPFENRVPKTQLKDSVISRPSKPKNTTPSHTKVVEISSSSSSSLSPFPALDSINEAEVNAERFSADHFEDLEADHFDNFEANHSRPWNGKESLHTIPTPKSRDTLKVKYSLDTTVPSKPDKFPSYVEPYDEKASVHEMERSPRSKNGDDPLVLKNFQNPEKQAGTLQPLDNSNDDRTRLSHKHAAQKPQLRSTQQASQSGDDTDKENIPFEDSFKLNHLKRRYHRKTIIDSATEESTSVHGKSLPKTLDDASYRCSEKTDELEGIKPIYKRPKVVANLRDMKRSAFKEPALHQSDFQDEASDLNDFDKQKRPLQKSRKDVDHKYQSRGRPTSSRAPVGNVVSKSSTIPRLVSSDEVTNSLIRPSSPQTKRITPDEEYSHQIEAKPQHITFNKYPTSSAGASTAAILKSPKQIFSTNRHTVKGSSVFDTSLPNDAMEGTCSNSSNREDISAERNRKRKSDAVHSESKKKMLKFEHQHNSKKKSSVSTARPGIIESLNFQQTNEKENFSKHSESRPTAKKRIREASVPASIVLESPPTKSFPSSKKSLRQASISSSIVLESPPGMSLKRIVDHHQGDPQEWQDSEQISDQGSYTLQSNKMYKKLEIPRKSHFPSPKLQSGHLLRHSRSRVSEYDDIVNHSDSFDNSDDSDEKKNHDQARKNSEKHAAARTLRFRLPSDNSARNKEIVNSVSKRHAGKDSFGASELVDEGYERKVQESSLKSSVEWPKESLDIGVVERLARLEKSGKRLNVDKILKGLNMEDDVSAEPGPSRQTKSSLRNEFRQTTVQARALPLVHKSFVSEASPSIRAPKARTTSTIWPESSRAQLTIAKPIRKERTERFVEVPPENVESTPPPPQAQTKYTNEHEQKISECMDQLTKIIIDNLGRKKNETKSAALDTHTILVRHAERVMNTCVRQSEQIVHLIQDQSQQTEERLVPFSELVLEMSEYLDEEASWIGKCYSEHRKKEKEHMKLLDDILGDLNT